MSQITIRLSIEPEDRSLNVDSLIGTIEIDDGLYAIVDDATFLDSWLYALIRGLAEVRIRSNCEIDLIDEPDPLVFNFRDGRLAITYKNMTVVADSLESFATDLRKAAASFIKVVKEEAGSESTEMLEEIERFAKSQS